MLRLTMLLLASCLVVSGFLGYASIGFVLSSVLVLLNLVVAEFLGARITQDLAHGGHPSLGMLVFSGKTMIVLAAIGLLGNTFGMAPAVLGMALTLTCFMVAVPVVALHTSHRTPLEST